MLVSPNKCSARLKTKQTRKKETISHTMLILDLKLMMQMHDWKLSCSLLCRVNPFIIVASNIENRETCVCKGPNNSTIKTEMLKQLGSVNSLSLTKVAEELSCDTWLRLKGTQSARTSHSRMPK